MISINEKALRGVCQDCKLEDKEILKAIISNLEYELRNSEQKGVGLSAIQVGVPIKLSIIRTKELSLDLINAKIISTNDKFIFKGEGCLSFPYKFCDTVRYNDVVIENTKISGEKEILNFTGFEAVAIQHEIDHQYGILFFDNKQKPIISDKKIGRNDKCSCGSGIKYKKCCGRSM